MENRNNVENKLGLLVQCFSGTPTVGVAISLTFLPVLGTLPPIGLPCLVSI